MLFICECRLKFLVQMLQFYQFEKKKRNTFATMCLVVCTIFHFSFKNKALFEITFINSLFYRDNLFKEKLYPNLCEELKQLVVDHVVYCAFT